MTAVTTSPTWQNRVDEHLATLSNEEKDALLFTARLALYLTLSKTDPQRLRDCLEVLRPLLENWEDTRENGVGDTCA